MQVDNLLRDLLKIPSPSGDEAEIGKFLVERLKKNFKIKTQNVGERFNVLAYIGNPKIILTTHMDTVPGELEIREDRNYIYGRGACDAKASIASMIAAEEKAVKQGIRDFGLLFDVGEEDDFAGIKKAVDLVKPEFVVIGEPTDFKVVIGQKGLLGIKIKCYGKAAAGSTPEKGVSAINKLIDVLNKINKIKFPASKTLGETTINVGKISGGIALNVVPDYAEAIVEIRTTERNENIISLIKSLGAIFDILYSLDPVIPQDSSFIRTKEKITVPYFTEMYFWNNKAKTIVFGPGEYEYAHSANERLKKSDLERAVKGYLKMITYLNDVLLKKGEKRSK